MKATRGRRPDTVWFEGVLKRRMSARERTMDHRPAETSSENKAAAESMAALAAGIRIGSTCQSACGHGFSGSGAAS
jgi:hypothetical protein